MIDKVVYPIDKEFPMKRIAPVLPLILLAAISGCSTSAKKTSGSDKPQINKIPLTAVPDAALAAAEEHVPGIYLHTAYLNHHGTNNVYELKGLSHYTDYNIYVTPDGHILDIDHDRWLSD